MNTKILILFACCLFSISGFAQINPATIKYQTHVFSIETGLGIGVRDTKYLMFAASFDMGLRYTWNFSPHIGWDVVKLKSSATLPVISAESEELFQLDLLDFLTGIRFVSAPRYVMNKPAYFYGAFRFGIAYYMDTFESEEAKFAIGEEAALQYGYTYELDFGVHFKHFFFGPKYSYLNMRHYFGINVGVDLWQL